MKSMSKKKKLKCGCDAPETNKVTYGNIKAIKFVSVDDIKKYDDWDDIPENEIISGPRSFTMNLGDL